jgi:hypothetical protein
VEVADQLLRDPAVEGAALAGLGDHAAGLLLTDVGNCPARVISE